jgi:hypothetical protein
MFTGFASENTPAIQVWNFFRAYTGTARISLADDCASIQLVKTGGSSSNILFYLPSAPIEGKRITIQNLMYGGIGQKIQLFSSDISGSGTNALVFTIGAGGSLDLIYSKDFISNGSPSGTSVQTGWVALNLSPRSSYNYGSLVIGSDNSNANEHSAAIFGGSGHTVSTQEGVIVGGANNNVSGFRGSVVGGTGNNAFGQYSGVFGGQSNTASGTNAAIFGANSSSTSNNQSIVVGGESNNSSAFRGAVIAGQLNNSANENAITLGGNNSLANGANSSVLGGYGGTTRSIIGYTVLPASSATIALGRGISQTALSVSGKQTTDATSERLTSNGAASGDTTNQVILPNNSAYTFQGTCIANVTGGGTTSGWKFEGVIKRGANAASTVLVAAVTPTVIAQDAGASTWVLAITADTTNGGIAVTVTGAAATTIRWVAKIETTEVTF